MNAAPSSQVIDFAEAVESSIRFGWQKPGSHFRQVLCRSILPDGTPEDPFAEARNIAACIPNARIVPLDSRNHRLREEEPAWGEFVRAMNDFLQGEATAHPPV